jgi:hypothetical protein
MELCILITKERAGFLTGTLLLNRNSLLTGNLLNRPFVKILAIIAVVRGNVLIRLFIDGVRLRGTLPTRGGTGHHTNLAGDPSIYCS